MARRFFLALLLLAMPRAGRTSPEDPTEGLNAERDALIDKIARGVEYEGSVRRFAALFRQRDAVVATSQAAKDRERNEHEALRVAEEARRKLREEYHHTNDYEVAWRCTLSVDPAHPVPSSEGRYKPDWGKVVRKEQLRLAPKNELDEGEPATLYEVAGIAGTYQFRGDKFGAFRQPFDAQVGDLVLVCHAGEGWLHGLPSSWGPRVTTTGFAVRLQQPPLIVKKAKWNPIHVTGSVFEWAIRDVRWKFPPGAFLLTNLEVAKDLGGGRWEVIAERDVSWVLEVPPSVKNQSLLSPGRALWVILGTPRFDKSLKKLVLVAEDLEARYIFDK